MLTLYTYGGMLLFRALCVELQRPPLYVTVCLTIFIEGIELLSTYIGWLNVETLERVPIPTFWHACKVLHLWVLFHEIMVHVHV